MPESSDYASQSRNEFWTHHNRIDRNWIAIGLSLKAIRDGRLWFYMNDPDPSDYASFEDYLRKAHDISKGYASRLINGADKAIEMQVNHSLKVQSEPIATELRRAPQDTQEEILREAINLSLTQNRPMTTNDVRIARLKAVGQIPEDVRKCAERLSWQDDPDRMEYLLAWYKTGQHRDDSKFWTAYHSGIIDPADGKPAIDLYNASLREIASIEKRWAQQTRDLEIEGKITDPRVRFYKGIANSDIMIDGQRVVLKGNIIQIKIVEFEHEAKQHSDSGTQE